MGHNSIKKYSIYWGNWSTLSTTAALWFLLSGFHEIIRTVLLPLWGKPRLRIMPCTLLI